MSQNKKSAAREVALKFLYQCRMQQLFYFSEEHFDTFQKHFHIDTFDFNFAKSVCEGVFEDQSSLKQQIEGVSENWRFDRMSLLDGLILLIACYELLKQILPLKL